MDAASRLFVEKGYDRTSIEDIVLCMGGGSKSSPYTYFGSKRSLLMAIVARQLQRIFDDIDISAISDASCEARLVTFAQRCLESLMRPENAGMCRLVLTEWRRFPDLASVIDQQLVEPLISKLDLVLRWSSRGAVESGETEALIQFLIALGAPACLGAMIGTSPFTSAGARDDHIVLSVRMFLLPHAGKLLDRLPG